MENLSVTEAATLAGVGKSTIRRAIRKGDLLATTTTGPSGEQFSISMDSFEDWMASRGAPVVHQTHPATGAPLVHQGEQAWDAVVESQQTVQKALEALERAQTENVKMAREVAYLEGKLNSQKQLLAANEERESGLQEVQAKNETALRELELHNQEQKERFEAERADMLQKLKTAESQAQQFEKIPRWVKAMFGT